MKRTDALRAILARTADIPVVVTLAATSRELAALEDRPNHLYLLDSMGLATSVALGVALAVDGSPIERTVCIEGDGSLLMNLGSLATIGALAPVGLIVVLLDNGVYASTADLPTAAERVDLGPVASACGLRVARADDSPRLEAALGEAISERGPWLIHAQIEPGNAAGVPLLLADPVVLGARFADWLARARGHAPG